MNPVPRRKLSPLVRNNSGLVYGYSAILFPASSTEAVLDQTVRCFLAGSREALLEILN